MNLQITYHQCRMMRVAASTPDLPTFHQELPEGHHSQSVFSSMHYFCNAGLMACKSISKKRNRTTANAVFGQSSLRVSSSSSLPSKLCQMGEWEILYHYHSALLLHDSHVDSRGSDLCRFLMIRIPWGFHLSQWQGATLSAVWICMHAAASLLHCRNSQWPAH